MDDRQHQKRVRDIFGHAHELEADEREAFLSRACGDDAALRAEVDSLLAALEIAGADVARAETAKTPAVDGEGPGTLIGPYKLLQRIDEGGMGTVFMAEQLEPVRRRVALKIIRRGLEGAQVVARFEAERQALALMDHQNIARVLDAGATAAGRPYFVMELVKGVPITEHCDRHNLSVRERLELFVPVCRAVQHAHQKGVIHRDIKPSNVLVTRSETLAIPKVIDFGIAKATTTPLTDKTLFTEFHALLGTPEYMSPEQADGSLDIDTRADVYGLGVLLYELLVGVTPFDPRHLRAAALHELLRILKEEDPPKPSTRASEETDESSAIAAHRRTEPRRLGMLMRGELDWIVMRCLRKDRSERYETANALALDIERYLRDEPVLASPPRAVYRLRKFVRRNRGKVAAGVLVLLTLVGGVAGTGWGLVEAKAEARKARGAEIEQARLLGVAEQRREEAEAERKKARELQLLADRRAEDVGRQLYGTELRLAMVAWRDGQPDRARELLDGSDPEQRGWEWSYLDWLLTRGRTTRVTVVPKANPDAPSGPRAHTPDGGRIVVADRRGEIAVFDTEPLRELCRFQAYEPRTYTMFSTVERAIESGPLSYLQLTADGRRVITYGQGDLEAKVWNATSGELVATLVELRGLGPGQPDASGRLLVTGGAAVRVWNLETGRAHCRLEPPEERGRPGNALATVSPDGTRVFGAVPDRIHVWDADSGVLVGSIDTAGFSVRSLTASPDGRSLVATGEDAPEDEEVVLTLPWLLGDDSGHHARVYDHAELRFLHRLELGPVSEVPATLATLAFSADGRLLASPQGQRFVVLNPWTGELVRTFAGQVRPFDTFFFTEGGDTLCTERWSLDPYGPLSLTRTEYDVATPHATFTIHTATEGPADLRFIAVGRELEVVRPCIGTVPKPSVTYDLATGRVREVLSEARGFAISRDRTRLAELAGYASDGVAEVRVAHAATGRSICTIRAPGGRVSAIAASPDGSRVAVATARSGSSEFVQRSTTRLFDGTTGRPLVTLHGNRTHVNELEFSPDGEKLVAQDTYGDLCIWNVRTWERILRRTRSRHHAFSPDGAHALISDDRGGLVVDARTGAELERLPEWTRGTAAAFHPDGHRLVTATVDRLLVRDRATGAELLELHTPGLRGWQALAFDDAGERLAALTNDGDLAIFECREPDASTRRARTATSHGQQARALVRGLRWHGIAGADLRGRLDTLEAERREDPRVLAHARGLVGEPDRALAAELNSLIWSTVATPLPVVREATLRGARSNVLLAPGDAAIVNTLGVALYRAGAYEEALGTLREAERIRSEAGAPPSSIDVAFAALALHALGRREEARAELVRAVEVHRSDESWAAILEAENVIAGGVIPRDAPATVMLDAWAARTAFRERVFGELNRTTAWAYHHTAEQRVRTRDAEGAERDAREALRRLLELAPDEVPLATYSQLLWILRVRSRLEDAPALYEELLAVARGSGTPKRDEAEVHRVMARHLRLVDDYEGAREASAREVAARRAVPVPGHPDRIGLADALLAHALSLGHLRAYGEAESAAREALGILLGLHGELDEDVALARLRLGSALRGQGRVEEAGVELDAAIETYRGLAHERERELADALVHRGGCHLDAEEWAPATRILGECLELRRKAFGPDTWYVHNVMSMLGVAHTGLGEFAVAERLLVEAAEKIEPPPHLPERRLDALRRVIALYEAWDRAAPNAGHAATAAGWRERLAAAGGAGK